MARDEVKEYLCKQLLKNANDNPNTRSRCLTTVDSAFGSLSESDRAMLDTLIMSAKHMDDSIDMLEAQIERSRAMTQCGLVEDDEIKGNIATMRVRKDDLDEAILDMILDGIGND